MNTGDSSKTPKIIGAVLVIALAAGAVGLLSQRTDQKMDQIIPDTTQTSGGTTLTSDEGGVMTGPDAAEPAGTDTTPPPTAQPSTPVVTQPSPAQSAYADGTYSATGNYVSPAGQENMSVTITLKAGVITDSQFNGEAVNPVSKRMQGNFSEGFKEKVVGKSIDSVVLTAINGASLVPKGFMDALNKIKQEAKA